MADGSHAAKPSAKLFFGVDLFLSVRGPLQMAIRFSLAQTH